MLTVNAPVYDFSCGILPAFFGTKKDIYVETVFFFFKNKTLYLRKKLRNKFLNRDFQLN